MIFSVLCFRVIIGISNIFYKGRIFSLLGMYSVEVYLSEWVSSGVYIWRYLWRWAFVMEAVVWLLGPPPLQDCWLLCVRGSLAQGPPFLGGGPNQLPSSFSLCGTLPPLTAQGGCHWECLPASPCPHLSLSLGFLTCNRL